MDDVQNEGRVPVEPTVSAPETGDANAESLRAERRNSRLNCRLKEIHDHRVDRRDFPTARTAVLRHISADLMDAEAFIAEALRYAMATTPVTLEDLDQYTPSIDLTIRLAKQITQTSQFEIRSSRCEK